jgi:hypothetical protein
MASKQSGTVPNDTAATPFSSRGGKPTGPTSADTTPPVNLQRQPSGGGDATAPARPDQYAPVGNTDTSDRPNTTYAPHLISRPQSPARASEDTRDQSSIPAGGITTKADPGRSSRLDASTVARGAPGQRSPFKNMK